MRILPPRFALNIFGRLALSLVAAALFATAAHAQEPAGDAPGAPAASDVKYEQMKYNAGLRQKALDVNKIVRNDKAAPSDEERKLVADYFKSYILARWTLPAEKTKILYFDNKDAMKGSRQEMRNMFRAAKSSVVYDYLNELALAELSKMAEGNYQPAARFNAVLALGELNVAEVGISETPKPLPKAAGAMLGLLKNDKQPDYIKVGALVGLNRHARLGGIADAATHAAVTAELLKFLAAAPPAGRSSEGHIWMLGQAAETLGRLGEPGERGAVVSALAALAANQETGISARREAVRALGRIKYDGASAAAAAKATRAVASFVYSVWNEEGENISRRRAKDNMAAVYFCVYGYDYASRDAKDGLGLASGATDAAGRQDIAVLKPGVKDIMDKLDDVKIADLDLMSKVGDQVRKIQKLAPKEAKGTAGKPGKNAVEKDS